MFSISKTLFGYRGKQLTYKQIKKLNRKKIKRNKRFKLYYIRTVVVWQGQEVVLYFTRKGKNGNWKVLLSTDLLSTFQETVSVYQIRWTIEVFFKESKQLLQLGKSQSNDFDGQIAASTITMVQYIFLALHKRVESYESIGQLYENSKEYILEQQLHERLIGLLIAIFELIESLFENADADAIMHKAITDEKTWKKLKKILQPPDTKWNVATLQLRSVQV